MRLIAILALVAFSSGAAFAEAAGGGAAPAPAATDSKAVNNVCVACGMAVDAKVAPVAGKSKESKEVMMGCCSDKCATEVKKTPDQYVESAIQNRAWKKEEKVK